MGQEFHRSKVNYSTHFISFLVLLHCIKIWWKKQMVFRDERIHKYYQMQRFIKFLKVPIKD